MDEYGNASDPRDSFSQGGYLAAKIITGVLRGIDGDITRQSVLEALQTMGSIQPTTRGFAGSTALRSSKSGPRTAHFFPSPSPNSTGCFGWSAPEAVGSI